MSSWPSTPPWATYTPRSAVTRGEIPTCLPQTSRSSPTACPSSPAPTTSSGSSTRGGGGCLGYCDFEAQDWESDANGDLDAWNDAARVYRLRIGCGYYSGYFVEVERDEDEADDLRESGATECGRPFEEYERAHLAHFLRAFAGAHGMQEYRVTARFSNGETFYEEVK